MIEGIISHCSISLGNYELVTSRRDTLELWELDKKWSQEATKNCSLTSINIKYYIVLAGYVPYNT